MIESFEKPLKIVGVLVVLIVLLFAARMAFDYVYYTLPPEQVKITVRYSPDYKCRLDSPVHMQIKNDSKREIISTSFSLAVKKDKSSENLTQLLAGNFTTDKVIQAGGSYEGCWSYPELKTDKYVPENLLYEIKRKKVVFSDMKYDIDLL